MFRPGIVEDRPHIDLDLAQLDGPAQAFRSAPLTDDRGDRRSVVLAEK
jgi:hypothetical protein